MDFKTLIFLHMHYILVVFEDHNSHYNEDSSILGHYATVTSGYFTEAPCTQNTKNYSHIYLSVTHAQTNPRFIQ